MLLCENRETKHVSGSGAHTHAHTHLEVGDSSHVNISTFSPTEKDVEFLFFVFKSLIGSSYLEVLYL